MNLMNIAALTMSSREIAELTEKRHDNVMADIRNMCSELGLDVLSFQGTYRDAQNRQQVEYHLNRELTETLVTGYSIPLRHRVIRRLHELEQRSAQAALPSDYITALEHLLASKRSEQLAIEQRDHAVATKAEIGARREATAMATASAAVREANRLRDELGFSARHATILKVETALKRSFSYVNLRRWCKANGVTPEIVPDKRYADGVKAWPAAAWAAVYQIDLATLFGADGEQA